MNKTMQREHMWPANHRVTVLLHDGTEVELAKLDIAGGKARVNTAHVSQPDHTNPELLGERPLGVELFIGLGAGLRMAEGNVSSHVVEGVGMTRMTPDDAEELGRRLILQAERARAESWANGSADDAA